MNKTYQHQEGSRRLLNMIIELELNKDILDMYNEDHVCCSYTSNMKGKVIDASYDDSYKQAINEFESRYDSIVYHVIEHDNNDLSLLFISSIENEWWIDEMDSEHQVTACLMKYNKETDKYEVGMNQRITLSSLDGAMIIV